MTGISGPAESKNPSVFCSVCVILHIRQVMDRLYSAAPDGYCGDEDNGQTSARYVFSALGFYPVCHIGEIRLNGTKYNSNFLSHSTLTEGATLHFTMCNPIHHHKPENHRPR